MMGSASHVVCRLPATGRQGDLLGERDGQPGDERGLRVAAVAVVLVLALPDRGLVRNDEHGETVRELEFERDDGPGRGKT